MNATPYNHARPARGESAPPARLSTLDDAVARARLIPHEPSIILVMFMHGLADIDLSWGILHSTGRTPTIDVTRMTGDPRWDDRVLPLGWRQRNQNVNYSAFVAAVRGWAAVRQLHLYGCQLGNTLSKNNMAQLAQDTGKEVWGYTGYTVTSTRQVKVTNIHSTRADAAVGACVQGAGFARVTLQASGGVLPGWQVRGRMEGASPRIDVCTVDDFGRQVVQVHTPQSIMDAFGRPERTVGI